MKRLRSGKRRSAIDGAAREEPEIADVFRDVDRADAPDRAVERARRRLLEPALLRAAATPHQHDIVAFLPGANHVRDELRRILQVGVDDDDRVAVRVVETRAHRHFLAEVARQVDDGDARVRVVQRGKQRPSMPSLAAVVHVDDFDRLPPGGRARQRGAGETPAARPPR